MKKYIRCFGGRYFQMYQTGLISREEAETVKAELERRIAAGGSRWSAVRVARLGRYRFAVYVC